MTASLNEKLRTVKWGEYKLSDLFEVKIARSIDKNKIDLLETGKYEFVGRSDSNNGVQGHVELLHYDPNPEHTFSLSQVGESVCLFRKRKWYASQNIFILSPKEKLLAKNNLFISSSINKALHKYKSAYIYPTLPIVKNLLIKLPLISDGLIDFTFMESFIAELEAERVAELSAYLTVSGLDNYELSKEEEQAIADYSFYDWKSFNLKTLFGKSTRGKRLKSEDRIPGTLPFVTAGEAEEGVSAFIGNDVEVFEKNTTTIDMFGSAKYRNYRYGGDDHVAIVHTENVPMKAAIFVTSACHKAAHTGKFDYGHNFYAKDADALDIMLPTKNGEPDYQAMELLISAIQKLVIKDIVRYTDIKISETKHIINTDNA